MLVPAYEPDHRLVELVGALRRELPESRVVVVDDGSGPRYARVFDTAARLGASVLHHAANRGKAAALRTGFAWLLRIAPTSTCDAVVCVDADGQHRPADVALVVAELEARVAAGEDDVVVLGSRAFVGAVPLRSRLGNRVTSALVRFAGGGAIRDTQTGLRAFPAQLLPWLLEVPGERFAYELRVLLEAGRRGTAIVEVPIETVYLDHNASSHFRPVVDSLRVMAPLLLFAASSLIAAGVDLLGVLVLTAATHNLLLAVVLARLVSATVNFALNRRAVFDARGPVRPQVVRYVALAVILLAAGYGGITAMEHLGLPLAPAKLVTDVVLWFASYAAQRRLVFGHSPAVPGTQHATRTPPGVADRVRLERAR